MLVCDSCYATLYKQLYLTLLFDCILYLAVHITYSFLPNKKKTVASYRHKAFCGTFACDGNIFLSACQGMYQPNPPISESLYKMYVIVCVCGTQQYLEFLLHLHIVCDVVLCLQIRIFECMTQGRGNSICSRLYELGM